MYQNNLSVILVYERKPIMASTQGDEERRRRREEEGLPLRVRGSYGHLST